jgi:excisionase family DNA binding protein
MADLVKPSRSTLPQGPNRAESRRRYITIPDAAEYLQVTTRTIRQMMADGRLTGYRAGSRLVRVDMNEIDDLMSRAWKMTETRKGRPAADRAAQSSQQHPDPSGRGRHRHDTETGPGASS